MSTSDSSLSDLKNLGPTSVQMLQAVGIETVDELKKTGAVLAYRILKHRFPQQVNLLFLYAMEGALTNRHWNSFSSEEKQRLQDAAEGDLQIGPA